MGKAPDLSTTQRREAVVALLRREEPASKLARRYNVSENTLYRWREDFLAGGESALAGKPGKGQQQRIQELEREVEQRDQVIGELTIANRFLKKRRIAQVSFGASSDVANAFR